ncbi:hypothetical protein MLD38_011241 [Melastoma candidum]|uniref:Uncharacterized protein n=1 Tax=Melastoma candidum TaxID=119954 RepID=A0ACB9R2F0_9MYRT|nr:hypothetical protein MLD38_011241 [Melastoma candidum]
MAMATSSANQGRSSRRCLKLLLLPWLAYGHISSYLQLAKRLSRRDFTVFLVSTPASLATLETRVTEEGTAKIHLVEIYLPARPHLPPHYHTTKTIPPRLNDALMAAFDKAGPMLSSIISNVAPDLLVYDVLLPWAPTIARSHGIPAVLFSTVNALTVSLAMHMRNRKGQEYPFKLNLAPGFRSSSRKNEQSSSGVTEGNGLSFVERCLLCMEGSSEIILIKSFRELEEKHMDYFSSLSGKKIIPVGPLVPDPGERDEEQASNLIAWLDEKDQSSTVFVSFGSECFLDEKELEEMAYGMDISNVNFIWVIRFPLGEEIALEDALPCGFLERVGNRGMLVEKWAPQARILAHPSVGGFVSHCGWGSVTESMSFGVPIIAVPMHLDQPLNARIIEEAGVGERVRMDEGGRLDRNEIARAVKHVLIDDEGESAREKAREIGEMIRSRGDAEIDHLVLELNKIF